MANAFSVPFGVNSGAALGVTCPTICTVAEGKPEAVVLPTIARFGNVLVGVHMPE